VSLPGAKGAHPYAPLDAGLTLQLASTNLQSSRLVYCAHGKGIPPSEPVHVDHDQQPLKTVEKFTPRRRLL
jgi:hypothetical protein